MAAVSLLAGAAAGQRSTQRKKTTPRALALIEWPAKGAPRLVPICILVDGQYYDAGIYLADPVPMSLDSGNVYEVEKSGDPQGFFTVRQAQQVGNNWYGIGGYRSMEQVHEAEKPKPQESTGGPLPSATSDEPPKLTRGQQPAAQQTPAPAQPAPREPAGDEPPVLRKPAEQQPATGRQAGAGQAGAPAPTQASPAPAQSSPSNEDPNRPVLRRGKPAEQMTPETIEPPKSAVTASTSAGSKLGIENPAAITRVLPAISDAKGPESRNYLFDWTPAEQERITRGMQDLARTSLQEYLKGRSDSPGPLQDVHVQAFDLDLSNEAVFVLTATAATAPAAPPPPTARGRRAQSQPESAPPAKPVTFYITVVARQNLEGNLRRIFRRITDSGHLDAYSRLELIDAVDVDGDGRGELLFRSINDQSRAFVIFRATVDNLTQVFNSRELER
ncbi:MAG TPA: hypothetical protein VFU76_13240 [Terriglobales bacterium]|nr:hypothetical protein [Terriglobales bacterium]